MLKIKQVTIKNFRSIQHLTLDVSDMNVYSGLNDVGKSNVLKALNLFFNEETDAGKKYDFDTDYCLNAPVVAKKAKTIEISLKIEIPAPFKDKGVVVWTKRWQRNGRFTETKDRKFSARSRAGMLFQRIHYRYVPAVKSTDYFRSLLRDLYACLASDVSGSLSKQTKAYSETIKKHTEISGIVRQRFGVRSALEYPRDQSVVFRELQFITDIENGQKVDLSHRGDGVQSMHIPAILEFMASKDSEGLASRSILPTTIWGYEEPENGLEIKRCFELADSFRRISNDIQIFVTSHSPAFYAASRHAGVKAYWFMKGSSGFTVACAPGDVNAKLGYMPMIAPYIEDKIREIETLRNEINSVVLTDMPTIAVEGVTDKAYLEMTIRLFSPRMHEMLCRKEMKVFARAQCGGTTNLCRYSEAWKLTSMRNRLVVVLDKDEAGMTARRAICSLGADNVVAVHLPPPEWILSLFPIVKNKNDFPYSIEYLFRPDVWEELESLGLLDDRDPEQLCKCFVDQLSANRPLHRVISEDVPAECKLYVKKIPGDGKKQAILAAVKTLSAGRERALFVGFEKLVKTLEEKLLR